MVRLFVGSAKRDVVYSPGQGFSGVSITADPGDDVLLGCTSHPMERSMAMMRATFPTKNANYTPLRSEWYIDSARARSWSSLISTKRQNEDRSCCHGAVRFVDHAWPHCEIIVPHRNQPYAND